MSRYFPEPVDPHALSPAPSLRDPQPLGIMLINLGTPDQPSPAAIRRYLLEFLSDPRVIEIPQFVWQPILRTAVLARRPHKLAPRYKDIWLDNGSPLLVYSQGQADGLQTRLQAHGVDAHVVLGMRYGNPSIKSAMEKLQRLHCERILVLPLYPQYAASTTATAVDCVATYAARRRNQPELRFVKRYHDDAGYINALANQVKQFWDKHGVPDRLLLSYHGLPQKTIELGDPYHRDCMETTASLRQALGEHGDKVHASFQSRFGAQQWLQPYTEPTLREWARQGVGRVDVMCPGFLADCLETLEEIQIECRDAFLSEGGKSFNYIPCLNDTDDWLGALYAIAMRHLAGWLPGDSDDTTGTSPSSGIN